jgi:hypothetical protein
MTITLSIWQALAILTTLACWGFAWRLENHGQWDFVTPLLWFALVVAPILAWGMFYLGVWLG